MSNSKKQQQKNSDRYKQKLLEAGTLRDMLMADNITWKQETENIYLKHFFLNWGSGDWTQDLMHAKYVLYL